MNTIVVGLELGSNDKNLIASVKQFNLYNRAKKIDFLHIHTESEVPKKVLTDFPEVGSGRDEESLQSMIREVSAAQIFGTELDYHTSTGDVLQQVLKKGEAKDVTLIILGHKPKRDVHHILFKKLARKINCDTLIIPDASKPLFKNILVAVDFSAQSKIALQKAIRFAADCHATITCLNIYEIPKGFYKTGKSLIEFAGIMRANAKSEWDKFLIGLDTSNVTIQPQFILSEDQDKALLIIEQAKQNQADLIMAGSKGHSDLGSFILGSVAESLMESSTEIPVWLSKEKGEHGNFWKEME